MNIEEDIRNYYIINNISVTETTVKLRKDHYMKLYEQIGDPIMNFHEFVNLTAKMNPATAKIYCDSVFVVHSARGSISDEVERYFSSIRKAVKDLPKKEIVGTIEDLITTIDHYKPLAEKAGPESREMDAYLIALFLYEFPLRNDLWAIKIRNFNKETDNYISNDLFILNHYKTANAYGPKKMTVPPHVQYEVLKVYNSSDRDYLFLNHINKPYTQQQMTGRIANIYKAVLNFPLSVSTIRKIKINDENQDIDIKDLSKLAEKFSHSIQNELLHYAKRDRKLI